MLRFFLFFCAGLLVVASSALAQTSTPDSTLRTTPLGPRELTGMVSDTLGNPLAGITVTVLADRDATSTTNAEGMYILTTKQPTPTLVARGAGFNEQRMVVTNSRPQVIEMTRIHKYEKQLRKRGKAAYKAWKH